VSIPEFRRQYEDKQQFDSDMPAATVYGRIRSKRQHGKFLLFVDVVNEFERLQGLISWKALLGAKVTEEQFNEFLHLIEVGDHICKRAARTEMIAPITQLTLGS
jgi:lysyl-tRNA synthetase class 2